MRDDDRVTVLGGQDCHAGLGVPDRRAPAGRVGQVQRISCS